jgi:hypothetical protein
MKRMIIIAGLFFVADNAIASGAYDFCIDRTSDISHEVFHARFKYGDIDPGKEAARVILSQRFRQPTTKSVGVNDYNPNTCLGPEVTEVTVSASLEQLQNLANAVGSGNVPGAAVIAVGIAAGATVSVVKETGNVLDKLGREIGNFIRCPFC